MSLGEGATHFKFEEYTMGSSTTYHRLVMVKKLSEQEIRDKKRKKLLKELQELDKAELKEGMK